MAAQGRLGDKAQCPSDSHGCNSCAHPVVGPAVAGSGDVYVNGKAALRIDDPGVHSACCGPNTWNATQGAPGVFFNNKKAHRLGDATKHCGGNGKLIEGSGNVFVGNFSAGGPMQSEPEPWFSVMMTYSDGTPVGGAEVKAVAPDGQEVSGPSKKNAYTLNKIKGDGKANVTIKLPRKG